MRNDFKDFVADAFSEFSHSPIGHTILALQRIGSTNDHVRNLIPANQLIPGSIVIADEQTAGKGRLGRSWHSEPGAGLWLSLAWKPEMPMAQWFLFNFASALAVAEAIEHSTELPVSLKWPNDVLLSGKKCCGILVETLSNLLIIGIGLNVNKKKFNDSLQFQATSLFIETGKICPRLSIFKSLIEALNRNFFLSGQDILAGWKRRAHFLNSEITVSTGNEEYGATACDVAEDGALIIERKGKKEKLYAGDVKIRF